jgi:hypothetical protein
MERVQVTSSNVAAVGHDGDETLEVEFLNGSVYQYFGVPYQVFEELRDAASVGGYLAANIKGIYRYSRV